MNTFVHPKGLNENAGSEFDGHEIGGQNIYRLKLD